MHAQESTVSLDATRIPVFQQGQGEPLVLFHGYMGSHLSWRHQFDGYARHFRTIAFDWLGWGASEKNPELDYSFDAEVDRLLRFFDELGHARVHFIGHDYGGFLGLGIAQQHPDRFRSFTIVNSRAHKSWRPHWYGIFKFMNLVAKGPKYRAAYRAMPLESIHRRFVAREVKRGTFTPDVLDYHCGWMSRDDGADYLAEFFRHYKLKSRDDLAAGLPSMRVPTQILWGARDPFLSAEIARDLAAKIPGAELHLYPRAHHFLPEELKETFVEDSLPFLLRHRQT